jgi:hypothetical protein
MKYLILTYESKEDFEARCGNEARQGQYWSAWKAYLDSMSHAGIIDSMHALLEDYTATTVRLREGKRQLHDGPYAVTGDALPARTVPMSRWQLMSFGCQRSSVVFLA